MFNGKLFFHEKTDVCGCLAGWFSGKNGALIFAAGGRAEGALPLEAARGLCLERMIFDHLNIFYDRHALSAAPFAGGLCWLCPNYGGFLFDKRQQQ
ncbi:hypothetical protein [Hydrogeniiclostridium mannosilyticum]|uniref:hypothetical protein n=1 Tax=Hydrogeniiclostridium mannosilyticum TaxID=2764322 RepID=UPI00399A2336